MTKSIEFYFDFSSPYAYIGYKEIMKYEKKNLFKIKFMPIFLGGLHNSAGVTPAAFNALKSKYMMNDTKLVSEKKNIKFIFNSYFPIKTVNFMRGAIIAEKDNFQKIYIENASRWWSLRYKYDFSKICLHYAEAYKIENE